eukprot:415958_1
MLLLISLFIISLVNGEMCRCPDPCPKGQWCVASPSPCHCTGLVLAPEEKRGFPALPEYSVSDHANGIHSGNDGNQASGMEILISANTVYVIGGLLAILLLMNIACLCYNCCMDSKNKTRKYSKVKQFASSDDDIRI